MVIDTEIQDAIKKSNLVFFIGAGFSTKLGLPTWSKFVKLVTEELIKKYPEDNTIAHIARQADKKKISELEALDALNAKYHPAVLEILGKSLQIDFTDKILKNHQKLWQITDQIVTTNYDSALETAAPKEIEVIVNQDYRGIARLSGLDRFLFKVHGSVKQTFFLRTIY